MRTRNLIQYHTAFYSYKCSCIFMKHFKKSGKSKQCVYSKIYKFIAEILLKSHLCSMMKQYKSNKRRWCHWCLYYSDFILVWCFDCWLWLNKCGLGNKLCNLHPIKNSPFSLKITHPRSLVQWKISHALLRGILLPKTRIYNGCIMRSPNKQKHNLNNG